MLVIIAGMTACKKSQTTTQTTTVASLPEKATTYIDNNYPDASIDYVVALSNSDCPLYRNSEYRRGTCFYTRMAIFSGWWKFPWRTSWRWTPSVATPHMTDMDIPAEGIMVAVIMADPAMESQSIHSLQSLLPISPLISRDIWSGMQKWITLCPNGAVIEVMLGMNGSENKESGFRRLQTTTCCGPRGSGIMMCHKSWQIILQPISPTYQVCDRGELFYHGRQQPAIYRLYAQWADA